MFCASVLIALWFVPSKTERAENKAIIERCISDSPYPMGSKVRIKSLEQGEGLLVLEVICNKSGERTYKLVNSLGQETKPMAEYNLVKGN